MTHDYEDVFDTEDLDDKELGQLVRQTLRDNNSIDPDQIHVTVRDHKVILSGQVGTDAERRIAERVIEDRIGITNLQSQLLVNPLRRSLNPEAADESIANEEEHQALLLGDQISDQDDTARHLENDVTGELFGTVDRMEAAEQGIPWTPPDSSTPEGQTGTTPERDRGPDSY